MYADPDDERFLVYARSLDAMFEEELQPRLRRALNRRATQYTRPDYVESAARQQRRPIFAVARYQHANIDLYGAWTGAPEMDSRGEGITENLYAVRDVLGRFKIHSSIGYATIVSARTARAVNLALGTHGSATSVPCGTHY